MRHVSELTASRDVCPTCGFPDGEPGFLRTYDEYGRQRLERCQTCSDSRLKQLAMSRAQSNRLEGELGGYRFKNYVEKAGDRDALKAALEFVDEPEYWLTLYGGFGRGKTHLAAAIHNELLERGVKSYFVEFPNLTSQLRQAVGAGDAERFYQQISQYPVLIVDEVDKADLRNWTQEQAFRLFNRRNNLKEHNGTVLVMNSTPDAGDAELGYLYSRMLDSRNRCVKVEGEDKRSIVGMLRQLSGSR